MVTPFGAVSAGGETGTSLTRRFSSVGDPELQLGYYAPAGSPVGELDAQETSSGVLGLFDENVNLGLARTAFLFTQVALDATEPIVEVVLRFIAGAAGSDPCPVQFFLSRDTSSLSASASSFNIASRPLYSQGVLWQPPPFVQSQVYETSNLLPLLAERLQDGPFDGRLLFIGVKAETAGCSRRVVSADVDIESSATLVVRY